MIFPTTPNLWASRVLILRFSPWFRYYAENSTGQCKRCSRTCKTCQGPKPTDCLSCDPFFFLLRSKGQCHRTCPEHHYVEQSTQTCERCHPTCDKCKGEGPSTHFAHANGKMQSFSFCFVLLSFRHLWRFLLLANLIADPLYDQHPVISFSFCASALNP